MTLFGRNRREHDLVEEIDTHLALAEEEYRRAGMSDEDARDAARRAFGGVLKTRQVYREQNGWRWFDALMLDARVGVRTLLRDRGFALTATLVLGLGIGVNNMMFTIIYAHTLRGLTIPEPDRVLMGSFTDERGTDTALSWLEYEEIRDQARVSNELAALGPTLPVAVGDPDRAPDRYNATYVTANALDTLGIRPVLGRGFTPDEGRTPGSAVALLGTRAWEARYARNPAIVGSEILVNGQPRTVVGILPDRSGFPSVAEVWLPILQAPGLSLDDRGARVLRPVGRVRGGHDVDEARAELVAMLTGLSSAAAGGTVEARLLPRVTPISARFFGNPTDPAWIAFITAGFLVLLVSCANVANLLLARGTARGREIAIRGSLGASQWRVFAQVLIETSVIAVAGAVLGLGLSLAFVRGFASLIPADTLPYWVHYTMDPTVFAALVMVALGTVLICGLLPAVQASKTDVRRALRDGGWGSTGRPAGGWTTAFMTTQIALAVVLLAAGVTNWLDETGPTPADRRIAARDILTASLSLPNDRYRLPEQRADFFRSLTERVSSLAGVTAVSVTSVVPRAGAAEQRLQLSPGAPTLPDELPRVWTVSIGPDYFSTLRIPLLQGREFVHGDSAGEGVAVVNRRFVTLFSPDEAAVGRRISVINASTGQLRTVTIVGVSDDITHRNEVDPTVYLPLSATTPTSVEVLVRSTLGPAAMASALRDSVRALDSTLPVFQAATLDRAMHNAGWNPRVSARLLGSLIVIVLVLSGVGLYAATAQIVHARTKEFGIRVAVGARPLALCRLVVHRAAWHVVLGLGFGVLGAMGWGILFGVDNSGGGATRFATPEVLTPIAIVLLCIMAAACALPIRQAVRLDPVATLRHD
jgi:putative ABC transport system permease protein